MFAEIENENDSAIFFSQSRRTLDKSSELFGSVRGEEWDQEGYSTNIIGAYVAYSSALFIRSVVGVRLGKIDRIVI